MNWFKNFFSRSPQQRVTDMQDSLSPHVGLANHAKQTRDVLDSLKRGGPIRKTGVYRLHKGERVLNKKQAMAYKMKK